MEVEVYADAQAAGRAAARRVARELGREEQSPRELDLLHRPDQKPIRAVLGLATGHTMIPVYGELVRLHEERGVSFKFVVTFNLDEYVGLGPGHPDSFHEFMMQRLVRQVDLLPENFHIPNGRAADLEKECQRYEEMIEKAGGIDLQLLGLGRNGHLGFNEPGSPPDSRTRVVELSEETRRVNQGDFRLLSETPRQAITMGLATILSARQLLLVVTGWEKSEILFRTLTSPPHPALPASFLHTHPRVTVIADQQAMELYRERRGQPAERFEIKSLVSRPPPGKNRNRS